MTEFTDANIPVTCAECEFQSEGVQPMIEHVLASHPEYTPEQAAEYVRTWADSSYDEIDAHNLWKTQEYRQIGHNPEDVE